MPHTDRKPVIVTGQFPPRPAVEEEFVLDLSPADIPLGASLLFLLRWFRHTVAWANGRGLSAKAVVSGLKPHVSLILRNLAADDRRRYAVHLRPLWLKAASDMTPEQRAAFASERGMGCQLRSLG